MQAPVHNEKLQSVGKMGDGEGGRGDAVGAEVRGDGQLPADQPERVPRIDNLLALRPDSFSSLDDVLAALRSIRLFRAVLDDVADPLKARMGGEDCPTDYFLHGLGVLAELQRRAQRLAGLEQRIMAMRLGAEAGRGRADRATARVPPQTTRSGDQAAGVSCSGDGTTAAGEASRSGVVPLARVARPVGSGQAAA